MRQGYRADAEAAPGIEKTFFGHPRGLAYLALTETWERFSFYGMSALVVLYMVQELFLPANIGAVAGMGLYRGALETIFGPLTPLALASHTFGFYTGLVFFSPVIGGLIADRLLGTNRTVLIGAILMCVGHLLMAFEESFLVALLLLILGSGCLKGNISAQVGHLYPPGDYSKRTRGYAIFSSALNIGAMLGPLVCGLLAQIYGWHVGFAAAGAVMFLSTIIYVSGQKHLPRHAPASRTEARRKLDPSDWKTIGLLALVMLATAFPAVIYFQFLNVGLVWISEHVELRTALGTIPVPWFNATSPLFHAAAAPVLVAIWRTQARAGREPNDIGKIAIGAMLSIIPPLLLVGGMALSGDGKVSALVPFFASAILGISLLHFWPPLMAYVSRVSPRSINSLMMGVVFLTLFLGATAAGWIGSTYESMSPILFWSLHALIPAVGAAVLLPLGKLVAHRAAARADKDEPLASALVLDSNEAAALATTRTAVDRA